MKEPDRFVKILKRAGQGSR